MKKKFEVLAMALAIFIAGISTVNASQASAIWVENDAVNLYRDPTANETFQPEFWTLRSKSGLYWSKMANTWVRNWHPNFGFAVKGNYAFSLNNPNVECPEEFMFRRYTMTWGQEAVGIGAGHIPNIQWYHYLLLFLLGATEETNCDCYELPPVCNNDGYCGAGETHENCSADCPESTTTTTTPPTTTIPVDEECQLIDIVNGVVSLQEGFKLNGQLDTNKPWVDQFPNSQNQVVLDCDYTGEALEFSVCTESSGGCPAPCPESPFYFEQFPGTPSSYHYRYVCP